jgi:methionine-rich copper-binding protein CopC
MQMQLVRGILSAAAATLLLMLSIASASAHAQLTSAIPAVGGNIAAAPSEVTLTFSEALEPSFSTVVVRDAVGKRIDKADVRLDSGDRKIMHVSLPPLAEGTYIVVWRALTADTHRTDGAFIFRVGQ